MLKTLKSWLTRRQAQRQWEEQQHQLAYELLGAFKATKVIVDKLSEEDRKNIASFLVDEKYLSLRKLELSICAQWIQQYVHEDDESDSKKIKKGGIMMYTAIHEAIKTTFIQRMQDNAEQKQMDQVMNGMGW